VLRDFTTFGRHVAEDWLARMSGLFGVILAVLGAMHVGGASDHWFWVASGVAIALAGFRTWQREHHDRVAGEKAAAEQLAASEKARTDAVAAAQDATARAERAATERDYPAEEAERRQTRDAILATLTTHEIDALHEIVVNGKGDGAVCDALEAKTPFVTRTFRGHKELNPVFTQVLREWHRDSKTKTP